VRENAIIRMLPDGRRLHLQDGPIDLIIGADGEAAEIRRGYEAAAARFETILDELCAELAILRQRSSGCSAQPSGAVACCMADAVSPYSVRCFITPMAAVAGAVAETVLSAMTGTVTLRRAYVNNGGDIALYLNSGESYTIGMIERPDNPSLFGSVDISEESLVRGIATSGWRGRSFSLGIADAVTVLAESASAADAAATVIANAVDLQNHPAVQRVPAREIAPDSDLLDLPVTRHVGALSAQEIMEAVGSGLKVAQELRTERLIHSAALCLQGRMTVLNVSSEKHFLGTHTVPVRGQQQIVLERTSHA
jgi:uncharacterized protein